MFILEDTRQLDRLQKELFDMVYQWGRVGVVTDQYCNAFKQTLQDLEYEMHQQFCEMYDICSSCGKSMDDGHYNNNAECN